MDIHLRQVKEKIELEVAKVISTIKDNFNTDLIIAGFNEWKKEFVNIYDNKNLTLDLYIYSFLLYLLGRIHVLKSFHSREKNLNEIIAIAFSNNDFNKFLLREKLKEKLSNISFYDILLQTITAETKKDLVKNIINIIKLLEASNINREFQFDFLIQNFIPFFLRHGSGEFFTPIFLVKKMINSSYEFGDFVLDPCCGIGNFIIELAKHVLNSKKHSKEEKIKAINRIYGFDINPLSIFLAKCNLIIVLKEHVKEIEINLKKRDFLFDDEEHFREKFDLIIGNPPWFTLRDISDPIYQNKIKKLSEYLEIKPHPKNVLNIEIASLFFYKAKEHYLKNKARLFFVVTKGLITGSHSALFRSFKGFSDVSFWMFSKNVEKIFNIDFICIFARKSSDTALKRDALIEFPVKYFKFIDDIKKNSHLSSSELVNFKTDVLIPSSIIARDKKLHIGKLISKNEWLKLIKLKSSDYKKLFHKGADLNPRALIFLKVKKIGDGLIEGVPDERVFKRAKPPWNKPAFDKVVIEEKYIFNVIKSTELVKFGIFGNYKVFLPCDKKDLKFNINSLSKRAKEFYNQINNYYLKYKKSTTKFQSLMENLNRWGKLINQRQLASIKVMYNNSGSILNSAVIKGDFIITGDLSFYATDNLDEAYYLSAVLNSNILTEQVRIRKSSRHIFKLPFDLPIQKFNPSNQAHKKLVELGKMGHYITEKFINEYLGQKLELPSKFKIQAALKPKLKNILDEIDSILVKLFDRA